MFPVSGLFGHMFFFWPGSWLSWQFGKHFGSTSDFSHISLHISLLVKSHFLINANYIFLSFSNCNLEDFLVIGVVFNVLIFTFLYLLSRLLGWGLWPRSWWGRGLLASMWASTWASAWALPWGFTSEAKSQVQRTNVSPLNISKSHLTWCLRPLRSPHERSRVPHHVRLRPPSMEEVAPVRVCTVSGLVSRRGDDLCRLLRWDVLRHPVIPAALLRPRPFNVVSFCRSYSGLLWRELDSDGCEGHRWNFRHLSCIVPVPAGWIYRPGNHDNTVNHIHLQYSPYYLVTCVPPGVWDRHASALHHGFVRPEEQTGPSRWGTPRCGSPGGAHWDVSGQQQWLRHQPHQGHCAEDLHRHCWLGGRCI